MELEQVVIIVGSNIVLILGMLGTLIGLSMHGTTQANVQIAAIHSEIKDFHARLCDIESRRKENK